MKCSQFFFCIISRYGYRSIKHKNRTKNLNLKLKFSPVVLDIVSSSMHPYRDEIARLLFSTSHFPYNLLQSTVAWQVFRRASY